MTERKYSEDEVREIFGLATSGKVPPAPTAPTSKGLTLDEIQNIGLEVGLEPDLVARAAATLDTRASRPARTSLGMPVEVARIVPLPRALTEHEWDQLVAELRATFRARGRVTSHGSIKEWWNGNLHACVEPTETGYRLRLGTLKGDAKGINALGIAGVVGGSALFSSLALTGNLAADFFAPWLISAAGVGALAANWIRLPRWARLRDRQMAQIAARVTAMMSARASDDAGPSSRPAL